MRAARRRVPRHYLAFLCVLAAVSLTACGDDASESGGGDSTQAKEQPMNMEDRTKKPATERDPEACLAAAELKIVEEDDANIWRGQGERGGVVVEKFPSEAKARDVVKGADLIVAEQVRRYAVKGPVKASDDGTTGIVADCLRG